MDGLLLVFRDSVSFPFRKNYEPWVYQEMYRKYFKDIESIHSALLERYEVVLYEQEIDWRRDTFRDEFENRHIVETFTRVRKLVKKATIVGLQYYDEHEIEPFTLGSFKESWKKITIRATNTPLEGYGIIWTQLLIEVSYTHSVLSEERQRTWASTVARVMLEGDAEIVKRAFDRIEESDTYRRKIRISNYLMDEMEKSRIGKIKEAIAGPSSFEDWVPEFRSEVISSYERLRELEEP